MEDQNLNDNAEARLKEEWKKWDWIIQRFGQHLYDGLFEWWKIQCENYAQAKIDQMFEEENNKNKGMVKVRGENGVTLVPIDELKNSEKQ